jgi:type IV pilus assembly protein PilY1
MNPKASSIGTLKRRLATGLAAAALALFQQPAATEDIDLFVQPAASTESTPNVLILLDNTANWNTAFTNEIAALVDTVNSLDVDKFRVGLMLFTETGGGNSNTDGGYVRAAIRNLDADYKTKMMALLNSLDRIADRSNAGKAGLTTMESYYYFAGLNPRAGNNKNKTDYTGNTFGTAASQAIYALPGNALDSKPDQPYNSPVVSGSCGKNFIIYISNGAAQDPNSDTTTARNALAALGGNTTTIPLSPSGSQSNVADEWSRFMKQSTYGVTTYTLDVDKRTTGQGPGWTALLKSMANVSEGKYFDVSSGDAGDHIRAALATIFSEIQAVNTVFASVSLPVSVNTEGTYLNQLYIGMFRPNANGLPRWYGNLKQYKLGLDGGRLRTLDADSVAAINSSTGFITECARSFWTPSSVDTYWSWQPSGGCLTVANSTLSNYPDGNVVEKGGQAYMLRGDTGARSPYKTCSLASCSSLLDLNSTNVSQADLGAGSTSERDALLNWAKGIDIDDEQINGNTSERRPSFHGDIVHSRPVAINLGPDDINPEVVVFYGGNDGALRAVNGNRTADIGSIDAGDEMWGFVPPEFHDQFKRLRDNTTPIDSFGNNFTSPLPKPYGFDGAITAHKSGSTLWVYGALRRGGRTIYAFDASSINTNPSNVTLKWRIGCPNMADDTGCTTNFDEIGQTWSAPKIVRTAFAPTTPMLIVGGGYDSCEDADPDTCGTTKGNRVYLLNADTGAWITEFNTDRGVVGDVFVLTDEATGLAKWAYLADLGGNIYRISGADANSEIADTNPTLWTMTKIASLGCSSVSACTPNRKFMMPLDIVEDLDGSYVILVGSGDREKPLRGFTSAASVDNYFFKIVDRPTEANWLTTDMGTCTGAICLDALLAVGADDPDPNDMLAHPKGLYLELAPYEQVVTSAITVFGTTTFSTHIPHDPALGGCTSTLGTAQVYNIDYNNFAGKGDTQSRNEEIVGGGLPPSPVAGMVTLDDGTTMPFLIGGDPNSPLEGMEPIPSGLAAQPKSQTYWYIHK